MEITEDLRVKKNKEIMHVIYLKAGYQLEKQQWDTAHLSLNNPSITAVHACILKIELQNSSSIRQKMLNIRWKQPSCTSCFT